MVQQRKTSAKRGGKHKKRRFQERHFFRRLSQQTITCPTFMERFADDETAQIALKIIQLNPDNLFTHRILLCRECGGRHIYGTKPQTS